MGDGDVAFTRIVDAFAAAGGEVIVANGGRPLAVYRFDRTGKLVWTVGREGEGPGEFSSIAALFSAHADTTIVYDWAAGRLTYLSPDGDVVRIVRIEEYPDPRGARAVAYLGVFSDGSFAAMHNYVGDGGVVLAGRHVSPLMRITADGSIRNDSLAMVPGPDIRVGGVRPLFSRPLLVRAAGETALVGDLSGARVRWVDLEGRELAVFARPIEARRVTPAMIESLKRAQLARVGERGPEAELGRRQIEERFARPVHRDTLPFFQRLIADLPSELWIQHYQAPTDSVIIWSIFDGDGGLEAESSVPHSFRITDVNAEVLVGVWTDEYDVESVRVYRR